MELFHIPVADRMACLSKKEDSFHLQVNLLKSNENSVNPLIFQRNIY